MLRALGRNRPALALSAFVIAVLGASAQPASAGCLGPGLEYDHISYDGVHMKLPVRLGRSVGFGTIPGCNDYVNADGTPANEPDTLVRVYRAGSVRPTIALMTQADSTVYLAPGFIPMLAAHPLHRAIFGDAASPQVPDCRRTTHLSGHTEGWPGLALLRVKVAHHRGPFRLGLGDPLVVNLRRSTVVTGSSSFGLPFVPPESRVLITGALCFGADEIFVARKVVVTGTPGAAVPAE